MYPTFLFIHSWFRWVVLILILLVIVRSVIGLTSNKEFTGFDGTIAKFTVNSVRLQLIVGLILYVFLSPITSAAFADFGAAMKDANLRYWAVEHIFAMIIATGLVEAGTSKVKKVSESKKKYKFQLIFIGFAVLVMLSRIPFDQAERLFR